MYRSFMRSFLDELTIEQQADYNLVERIELQRRLMPITKTRHYLLSRGNRVDLEFAEELPF